MATEFRSTCKLSKCILDNTDVCLNEKDISKIKIIKNRSRGLTSMIRNESGMCVICQRPSSFYKHPFYGLNVHRGCTRKTREFRISSIIPSCRKYFVSEEDVENIPHVMERGRKSVLESHVEKIAIDRMGIDEFNRRVLEREDRSEKIKRSRECARNLRTSELKSMFDYEIRKSSYHIREEYMDFDTVLLMAVHISREEIIGDILRNRVKSDTCMAWACFNMIEVSRLLSTLDENNLLVRVSSRSHAGCPFRLCDELRVSISFRQIVNRSRTKEHFTKFIPKYARAIRSFGGKSGPFEEYSSDTLYLRNPEYSSVDDRYNIAVYACELDNVEFEESSFDYFIEDNFGCPFMLARKLRYNDFISENGHSYVNKFGYDPIF